MIILYQMIDEYHTIILYYDFVGLLMPMKNKKKEKRYRFQVLSSPDCNTKQYE